MTLPEPIQIQALPQSIEEYIALQDQVAQTPQGGAAMMVIALLSFTQDETLGQQCLAAAVGAERLDEGLGGYLGRQLRLTDMRLIKRQIKRQAYLPQSYIRGATPENGYQLPAAPYVFEFASNPYSGDPDSGAFKAFIACSGASSPRPVKVARDDRGVWKASEWSSLLVGIVAPE